MFIKKLPFKTFYLFIRASIEVEPPTRLQFAEFCPFNYKQAIDKRSVYYVYAKVAQFCNVYI